MCLRSTWTWLFLLPFAPHNSRWNSLYPVGDCREQPRSLLPPTGTASYTSAVAPTEQELHKEEQNTRDSTTPLVAHTSEPALILLSSWPLRLSKKMQLRITRRSLKHTCSQKTHHYHTHCELTCCTHSRFFNADRSGMIMIDCLCILSSKPSFGICLASFPFDCSQVQVHVSSILP